MLSSLQIATTGALPMPAPWLLKGFQDSGGGRDAIARPDLFPRRRNREKLRVVNFIGLSGPAGIWGLAGTNSMMLAASEINRRGGILGREIEPVFHDAGGDIDGVVRTAADMIAAGDVDVIMGSHISAVRVALRKVIAGRVPYIYTPVYEGGERTPGVMAIGETPRDQSRPAIEWLASEKKAARWYLIGSDYVWPWLGPQGHQDIHRRRRRARGR
jgi:urea transport system substrate-binding protein